MAVQQEASLKMGAGVGWREALAKSCGLHLARSSSARVQSALMQHLVQLMAEA